MNEERQLIEQDGFLVDPETGEIVEATVPESGPFPGPSQAFVESVIARMRRHAAQAAVAGKARDEAAAAVEAMEKRLLEALQDDPEYVELCNRRQNAAQMTEKNVRRVEFLELAYASVFREFAHDQLAGTGSRTWESPLGRISLRTVPARLEVANPEMAANWLELAAPEAVKRSVQVSKIPEALRKDILANGAPEASGLAVVPESERVSVNTGIAHDRKEAA